LNFPFAALASGGGVASAAPDDFAISQMVRARRLELLFFFFQLKVMI
jgi:hypothetical protein